MIVDQGRVSEIVAVYRKFCEALGDSAPDAVKLTEVYFAAENVDRLREIAFQIGRSELEKQEFYEWRKKDPHAVTKPPLGR